MHAALLANRAWLDEELSPFKHLLVGLIDEQVRVAQVVPADISPDDLSGFGDHVPWRESPSEWLNTRRLSGMGDTLGGLGVTLVHALHSGLWRAGLALGESMNVPVILSASSRADIAKAQKLAGKLDPSKVALTAATEPLTQALVDELGPDTLVHTIPSGVHHHNPATAMLNDRDTLCAIVSGSGVLDKDYEALLSGIASFVLKHPSSQFFFDGQDRNQHQIWKLASSMGLLPNISLIPRRLGHRDILLRAHVLIHPQALGMSRSLILRAFARGMTVLAKQDDDIDYLIDGETAIVLDNPGPEDWASQFDRLIEHPTTGDDLADGRRRGSINIGRSPNRSRARWTSTAGWSDRRSPFPR